RAKPLPQARAHSGAPAVGSDPRPKERSTPRSLLGAAPGKTLEPGKGAGLPAQGIGSPASPTGVAPKGTTNRLGTVHRGGGTLGGSPPPNAAQIKVAATSCK